MTPCVPSQEPAGAGAARFTGGTAGPRWDRGGLMRSPPPAPIRAEWVHPLIRFAFYVFLFSIPLEYPDRSIPVEVHTITGSLLLAVAIIQPRVCFRRPHATFWWLAGFLWLYVARGLFSEHAAEAAKLVGNFLLVALVFWVVQNLMRHTGMARRALVSFAAGCAVIAILQVLNIGTTESIDSMGSIRVTVFDQDENLLGANMALALIAFIGLSQRRLMSERWRDRKPAAIALATPPALLLGYSLLLSGSRGAALAAVAGLLMLSLGPGHVVLVLKRVLVGGSVTIVLGWLVVTASPLASRFSSAEGGNLAGREHLYPEAWAMFLEKPVLGWGPIDNAYELAVRTASFGIGGDHALKERKDPHNILLELLTETGVVGALPLLVCLVLCLRMAWRGRAGPQGTLPMAWMAASLVVSLDVNWLATQQLWVACAYAVAAGALVRQRGGEHAGSVRRVPVPDVLGDVHRSGDDGTDWTRRRRAHRVAEAPLPIPRAV